MVAEMYLFNNVLVSVISTILLMQVKLIGSINSTVCYGVPGLSCTTHSLSCPSPLVMQIINTSYGYRPGCNDANGLTGCSNTTCCNEEPGDCFIPFSSEDDQQVADNCNGLETCEIRGFRRYNTTNTVCNDRIVSAYSKIQYDCASNDNSIPTSTPTTYRLTNTKESTVISTTILLTEATSVQTTSQPTTTISSYYYSSTSAPNQTATGQGDATSDVGSIVGGIVGTIIIIVIIIVVVVFLYKRRNKLLTPPSTDKNMTVQTVTPQYHVIDGPGTINNRQDTSGYDEIELESKPRVQDTGTHLNQSTINNCNETSGYEYELGRQPKRETTDNYDHVGHDKLKITSSKGLDNYNHIGTHDHSTDEDNYNHIGNNLSSSSRHLESDYNHINFNDEVDYNHIGDTDNKNVITDDNYHHIGSGDIKVEGDYDHIGSGDNNVDVDQAQGINPDDSDAPYNYATC